MDRPLEQGAWDTKLRLPHPVFSPDSQVPRETAARRWMQ